MNSGVITSMAWRSIWVVLIKAHSGTIWWRETLCTMHGVLKRRLCPSDLKACESGHVMSYATYIAFPIYLLYSPTESMHGSTGGNNI
jgi:hypothetical protein